MDSTTGRPLGMRLSQRLLLGLLSLGVAAAIWLPCVHLLYRWSSGATSPPGKLSPKARRLAARHLRLWTDPDLRRGEIEHMRARNAEWDFMGRTFLVLALANAALREPATKPQMLEVMDRIIDETLRLDAEEGMYFFLMPYAKSAPYVLKPPRSQFVDGEIALMLAARRAVAEKPAYKAPLRQRVDLMVARMSRSPVLCAESYPNECWTFCNTVGLAAIRIGDVLDGTDHSEFLRRWMAAAKAKLIDERTGLLISSFTVNSQWMDGPEGTTIWAVAHFLQIIDPAFAADQYARARKALGRSVLGFGYSREWPPTWEGALDVDSGPVVPGLGASASASGLAIVGARAFGDADFAASLVASLDLAGFPIREDGTLRYAASNQVGDAVVLYALVQGPLWERITKGAAR